MVLTTSAAIAFLLSMAGRFAVLSAGMPVVENRGIAFGIDIPLHMNLFLIPIALLAVAYFAWKDMGNNTKSIGFGLVIGGAMANIVDRIGDGLVVDFIDIGWWPVFNVADVFITVGIVILLYMEFFLKKRL